MHDLSGFDALKANRPSGSVLMGDDRMPRQDSTDRSMADFRAFDPPAGFIGDSAGHHKAAFHYEYGFALLQVAEIGALMGGPSELTGWYRIGRWPVPDDPMPVHSFRIGHHLR